jgi:hypothetical protein
MNRFQRRYTLLKGQGRCVRCAEKLPEACPTLNCPECQETQDIARGRHRDGYRTRQVERKEVLEARIAKIVETAPTLSAVAQATLLGVPVDRIYGLRAIARKRGHEVPVERGGHKGGYHCEPGKWAALDKAERCPRCDLLLPHETCLAGDATARPGAGRVFPDCR